MNIAATIEPRIATHVVRTKGAKTIWHLARTLKVNRPGAPTYHVLACTGRTVHPLLVAPTVAHTCRAYEAALAQGKIVIR